MVPAAVMRVSCMSSPYQIAVSLALVAEKYFRFGFHCAL